MYSSKKGGNKIEGQKEGDTRIDHVLPANQPEYR